MGVIFLLTSLPGSTTGGGGTVTSTAAGHLAIFQAHSALFPNWNDPSPFVYYFSLPPEGWANIFTLGQAGIMQSIGGWLSGLMLQIVALVLHIGIFFTSELADPGWLITPLATGIGKVFHYGYQNIFVKFIPFLVLGLAAYVLWQYVKGRHAKILTSIASTVLSTLLIFLFFFNFQWAFTTVNNEFENFTNNLGSAVVSTVSGNANIDSVYDGLWYDYVVYPWEYGQFGQSNGNSSAFNVNSYLAAQKWTYQNDAGTTVPFSTGGNWLQLYMTNVSASARNSLESALTKAPDPFAGNLATEQALKAATPASTIVIWLIELILMTPTIIFLGYMGFLLFAQELMFMITAVMGVITVPISFVPEVGWQVTFRWLRESIGYLFLRVINVVYMAVVFMISGTIQASIAGNGSWAGLLLGFLTNAIIFLTALLYRNKVFEMFARPVAAKIQGVGMVQQNKNTQTQLQKNTSNGQSRNESNRSENAGVHGRLAERFGTNASSVGNGIQSAATLTEDGSGEKKGISRWAEAFGTASINKVNEHLGGLSRPQTSTWQQRAQKRRNVLHQAENIAHDVAVGAALKSSGATIKAGQKVYQTGEKALQWGDRKILSAQQWGAQRGIELLSDGKRYIGHKTERQRDSNGRGFYRLERTKESNPETSSSNERHEREVGSTVERSFETPRFETQHSASSQAQNQPALGQTASNQVQNQVIPSQVASGQAQSQTTRPATQTTEVRGTRRTRNPNRNVVQRTSPHGGADTNTVNLESSFGARNHSRTSATSAQVSTSRTNNRASTSTTQQQPRPERTARQSGSSRSTNSTRSRTRSERTVQNSTRRERAARTERTTRNSARQNSRTRNPDREP